eukprot:3453404-Pleurochrysis_carterae.AAC.1
MTAAQTGPLAQRRALSTEDTACSLSRSERKRCALRRGSSAEGSWLYGSPDQRFARHSSTELEREEAWSEFDEQHEIKRC